MILHFFEYFFFIIFFPAFFFPPLFTDVIFAEVVCDGLARVIRHNSGRSLMKDWGVIWVSDAVLKVQIYF